VIKNNQKKKAEGGRTSISFRRLSQFDLGEKSADKKGKTKRTRSQRVKVAAQRVKGEKIKGKSRYVIMKGRDKNQVRTVKKQRARIRKRKKITDRGCSYPCPRLNFSWNENPGARTEGRNQGPHHEKQRKRTSDHIGKRGRASGLYYAHASSLEGRKACKPYGSAEGTQKVIRGLGTGQSDPFTQVSFQRTHAKAREGENEISVFPARALPSIEGSRESRQTKMERKKNSATKVKGYIFHACVSLQEKKYFGRGEKSRRLEENRWRLRQVKRIKEKRLSEGNP